MNIASLFNYMDKRTFFFMCPVIEGIGSQPHLVCDGAAILSQIDFYGMELLAPSFDRRGFFLLQDWLKNPICSTIYPYLGGVYI